VGGGVPQRHRGMFSACAFEHVDTVAEVGFLDLDPWRIDRGRGGSAPRGFLLRQAAVVGVGPARWLCWASALPGQKHAIAKLRVDPLRRRPCPKS